jgi:hypothetical protein
MEHPIIHPNRITINFLVVASQLRESLILENGPSLGVFIVFPETNEWEGRGPRVEGLMTLEDAGQVLGDAEAHHLLGDSALVEVGGTETIDELGLDDLSDVVGEGELLMVAVKELGLGEGTDACWVFKLLFLWLLLLLLLLILLLLLWLLLLLLLYLLLWINKGIHRLQPIPI